MLNVDRVLLFDFAARLERSSFCGTKWSKKAGVEGGKSCHKKMKAESYSLPASQYCKMLTLLFPGKNRLLCLL